MVVTMDSNYMYTIDTNDVHVGVEATVSAVHEQLQDSGSEPKTYSANVPESSTADVMVRSVAMSANIANTVKSEVNHSIRVDAFNDYLDELVAENTPSTSNEAIPIKASNLSCSHILPAHEENIVLGIILSKWDDIMGPQTVHSWLQNSNTEFRLDEDALQNLTLGVEEIDNSECGHRKNNHLMKAIKYVTSHTVNYVGVTTANLLDGANYQTFREKNTSLFIVQDLNLVAQSLVFQLRGRELNLPYSLAIMVKYDQYDYYLHLRRVSQLWLQWISAQLHQLVHSCIQQNKEFVTSQAVNQWVLEFNNVLISLKTCGLGLLSLTWKSPLQILKHPLLERALTSHLQTFGCTVIMGPSADKINDLIAFLALFLETDELFCSRLLLPPYKYSFHKGLYIQGLILDEFGCRELSSEELSANPYPVTAIDLTRGTNSGAIKQSPFFKRSTEASKHQSMLCPAKDSRSSLVDGVVRDLKLLPMEEWKPLAELFLVKVKALAHTLLSLAFCVSSSVGSGRQPSQLRKYLGEVMNLEDPDFLIVLASAEKIKPGIYSHVLYSDLESR